MKTTAIVFTLLVVFSSATALADVPSMINFQGTLTDEDGVALDTTVAMQFEIYNDSTGGSRLWVESQIVTVSQGVFNVLLGRTEPVPDSVFTGSSRWLAFLIGAGEVMEPRLRLASVGYAFKAAQSDTADYARSAPAASDGDWTLSGGDMYSAVSGNVGIGTGNPACKLDVVGDSWRQIRARGTDDAAAGAINVVNDLGDYAQFALRGSGAAGYPGDLVIGPYSQTEDLHLGNGNFYPRVTITPVGRVGIGITAPTAMLDVRSPSAISDYFRGIHYGYDGDDGGAWISTWGSSIGAYAGGAYYHNAGNWTAKSTSASSVVLNSGHVIFNANSGLADDEDFFPTERMRITNAGNVGIGTTAPGSKLEVAGTVHSTSGGFKFPDGSTQTSASDADGHSLDADDGSPANAVYVDADGDVGIGVISPAARLDVHHDQDALSSVGFHNTNISSSFDAGIQLVLGDNNGPPKLTLRQSGDGSVHHSYISHVDNSSSHLILENQNAVGRILLKTNSGTRMSIDQNGDVGIGTASPGGRLQIDHAGGNPADEAWELNSFNTVFYELNGSWGAENLLLFKNDVNSGTDMAAIGAKFWGSTQDDGTLGFATATDGSLSVKMVVQPGGDVGIGAMNPAEKLEVAGNLLLSDGTDNDAKLQIDDAGGSTRLALGAATGAVGVISGSHMLTFLTDTDDNNTVADFIWGTNGNSGSYSELMRLTDEGNLGIGTLTPSQKLEVADTIYSSSGGFKFPNGTVQTTAAGANYWAASGNNIYNSNSSKVGIGTSSPSHKLHVSTAYTDTSAIYGKKEISSGSAAGVMGVSGTRNFGYLGGEMATSSEPISDYNYGVYGRVQNTGWGGFGGMFYNTHGNWAALAGDTQIGYNYGVYAKNSNGNWGYLAGGSSGAYGRHDGSGCYGYLGDSSYGAYGKNDTSGCYGYMGSLSYGVYGSRNADEYGVLGYSNKTANYFYHRQVTSDGDGQSSAFAYRLRDSQNDGTSYASSNANFALLSKNFWGDVYSFGVGGYNDNDYTRCGGVIGAKPSGNYWGSLGYKTSGGSEYGGYFTSSTTGTGKELSGIGPAIGIGMGSWGELFGADIHGQVYGTYTEGADYALYSHGTVFKDDLDVHLQHVRGSETSVLYTNVSTDVTVQTSGFASLSGGKSFIKFDEGFRQIVSSEVPIVVTVTPTGDCNGVHVSQVTREGFAVVENNAGKSSVQVAFIAIGRRAGYEDPKLPEEVVSSEYVEKVSRGLHNDGDTLTDGEGLYLENGRLYVGVHPSTLPDPNKREGALGPSPRVEPERAIEEDEPVRRSRGSNN